MNRKQQYRQAMIGLHHASRVRRARRYFIKLVERWRSDARRDMEATIRVNWDLFAPAIPRTAMEASVLHNATQHRMQMAQYFGRYFDTLGKL